MALPGCGKTCLDDGAVWNQDAECMLDSASASNSATEGTATETATMTQPTDGGSDSVTATDTASGSVSDSATDSVTGTATDTGGNGPWCEDKDGDGFGDPMHCEPEMFPGSVPNDDDCDDGDPNTFPGAAPNDDPDKCMTDADGDDWGDENPGPGVDPGTDCTDGDAGVHDGCMCSAGDASCVGDDLHVCNEQGSGEDVTTCEFGCDDADPKCFDALTVDAGPSLCVDPNMPVQLNAVAMGGDGMYGYSWSPANGLDDPMLQSPTATPMQPTAYTVDVMDGEGNMASDSVSVFVADQPLQLDPAVCTVHDFPHENNPDNNDPVSVWDWDANNNELCQTLNAKASALFCGWELDNATLRGTFVVNTAQDDDWLGFMWGIQDTGHFYVFTWKQLDQIGNTCGGVMTYAGMQVKVIDVADEMANPLSCPDIHEAADTVNSRLLASVDQFTTTGWADNTAYNFELTHLSDGNMNIAVRRADNDMLVAEHAFVDTTYPKGKFGMYTKSQINACFSDLTVSCEP